MTWERQLEQRAIAVGAYLCARAAAGNFVRLVVDGNYLCCSRGVGKD